MDIFTLIAYSISIFKEYTIYGTIDEYRDIFYRD
jgi:hypothetical protein